MDHRAQKQIDSLKLVDHAGIQHDWLVTQSTVLAQLIAIAVLLALNVHAEVEHRLGSTGQAARQQELLKIHTVWYAPIPDPGHRSIQHPRKCVSDSFRTEK